MKNILSKLHKIMQSVDYIQKDKKNNFHNYKYASEYAIKEKLHQELVKNGVLFTLSAESFTNTGVTTAKGNQEMLTTILFSYAFYDVETGEKLEGKFIGSGQDSADKGSYKAITGAIKYILTSTFLIPTGDDPEEDGYEKNANTVQYLEDTSNNLPLLDADEAFDRSHEWADAPKQAQEGDPCPKCEVGVLRSKKGRYGPFLGCDRYPDCKNIVK